MAATKKSAMQAKIRDRFETYVAEVQRQLGNLGLSEWGVSFQLCECGGTDDDYYIAKVQHDMDGMWARFYYSNSEALHAEYQNPVEDARHEVAHLLVAKLATMADMRYVTVREIDNANEEIARRLERVL